MIRSHIVKTLRGSTYEIVWTCNSCEHVEFIVDGESLSGWYSLGYDAAKEKYLEYRSILDIIP